MGRVLALLIHISEALLSDPIYGANPYEINGASLVDWPISYEEHELYCVKVEEGCGIVG